MPERFPDRIDSHDNDPPLTGEIPYGSLGIHRSNARADLIALYWAKNSLRHTRHCWTAPLPVESRNLPYLTGSVQLVWWREQHHAIAWKRDNLRPAIAGHHTHFHEWLEQPPQAPIFDGAGFHRLTENLSGHALMTRICHWLYQFYHHNYPEGHRITEVSYHELNPIASFFSRANQIDALSHGAYAQRKGNGVGRIGSIQIAVNHRTEPGGAARIGGMNRDHVITVINWGRGWINETAAKGFEGLEWEAAELCSRSGYRPLIMYDEEDFVLVRPGPQEAGRPRKIWITLVALQPFKSHCKHAMYFIDAIILETVLINLQHIPPAEFHNFNPPGPAHLNPITFNSLREQYQDMYQKLGHGFQEQERHAFTAHRATLMRVPPGADSLQHILNTQYITPFRRYYEIAMRAIHWIAYLHVALEVSRRLQRELKTLLTRHTVLTEAYLDTRNHFDRRACLYADRPRAGTQLRLMHLSEDAPAPPLGPP